MVTTDFNFSAEDGRILAGTVWLDAAPRAALVIFSALGVPRAYYRHFAAYMAGRGVAVITFDYRGVGDSRLGSLKEDDATLTAWATLDMPAAITAAKVHYPDLPLWALGHSFGGQAMGISQALLGLQGAIITAAGSGDMALYPTLLRWRYGAILGLAVPVVSAVCGYIPGALGLGADLPSGVVREWARLCHTRGYIRAAFGPDATVYAKLAIPMRFYDMSDDVMAPQRPSAELRSWFTAADIVHRTVTPEELGLQEIGHFGLYRPGATEPIWAEIAEVIGA